MKKIVLSLATLAALTSTAFASQRGYELRDVQPWKGQAAATTMVETNALAATGDDEAGLSNFERTSIRANERDHGAR